MPSSSRDENSGSEFERGGVRFVRMAESARQAITLGLPALPKPQLPSASRRPLRPSALPAPRPRIAVGLSSCGSGGPCRAKLLIADPRDRIEEIVMHGNWKGLVFLLNEDRNQILSPALVRHSP